MDRRQYEAYMLTAYLSCALFIQFDTEDNVTIRDFSPSAKADAMETISNFLDKAYDMVKHVPASSVGHDLYLTQTHQGSGFWDRHTDYDGKGDELIAIAHEFTEVTPVKGDDGLIYLE